MNTQLKDQTPKPLPQKSHPYAFGNVTKTNNEEISPMHRYDASITMIASPEKDLKTRTFILINGSQPEVTDHQGILWSQSFFNKEGKFLVDLGEKIY